MTTRRDIKDLDRLKISRGSTGLISGIDVDTSEAIESPELVHFGVRRTVCFVKVVHAEVAVFKASDQHGWM